jgi:hypothetical protein
MTGISCTPVCSSWLKNRGAQGGFHPYAEELREATEEGDDERHGTKSS